MRAVGWEKLSLAVQVLCGNGPLRYRLYRAVVEHLVHVNPQADLPAELVADYSAFIQAMTAVIADDVDGDRAAMGFERLDNAAIDRALDQIIAFHDITCRYMPRSA